MNGKENVFDYWQRLDDDEQEKFLANYKVKRLRLIQFIKKLQEKFKSKQD